MKEIIKEAANKLGIETIGMSNTTDYSHLEEFLLKRKNNNLDCEFEEGDVKKRINAKNLFPELRTIITVGLPYGEGYKIPSSGHNEDLKSLTRYRFDKVMQRAKLKQSVSRLVNILFPELETLVSTLHGKAVYELLLEFPSAQHIASANLKHLTHLLNTSSKGRFKRVTADEIREAARKSISSYLPAKSLELKHTIKLIREITLEITEIEAEIKKIMDAIDSPILGVPGIGQNLGAMIIAEIGDFSRFDSADKILAFAGCSPSTYQSGQLYSSHAKMEKRGSRYLRWALLNAAAYVCNWEPTFAAYLQKKRSEGKHYYVALSHAAKKLVRVLYHLETTGETYSPTAILS
jgi:transposase